MEQLLDHLLLAEPIDQNIAQQAHAVGELEAGRSEVRHVLQRFFGNSRERLLLSLLGDDEIGPGELKRLKETIALAPDDAQEVS